MRAIRNSRGGYALDMPPRKNAEPPPEASEWLVCPDCECRFWLPETRRQTAPLGCPNCNPGEHWAGFDWWLLTSWDWDDQEAAERFRARCRETRRQ